MKRDSGIGLAIGAALSLVAAGQLARRGSLGLSDIRLQGDASRKPSQPFAGIVGAASGGPKLEVYKRALERAPFNLTVVLSHDSAYKHYKEQVGFGVGTLMPWSRRYVEERLRGQISYGDVVLLRSVPPSPDRSKLVERFALMSPHTLAHQLFDAAISFQPLANELSSGFSHLATDNEPGLNRSVRAHLSNFVISSLESGFTFGEEARAEAPREAGTGGEGRLAAGRMEQVYPKVMDRLQRAMSDILAFTEISDLVADEFLPGMAGKPQAPMMDDEDIHKFPERVFSSLICPTAAGRAMILADISQAGAECFAVWCMSYNPEKGRGSIPMMSFEPEELAQFSARAWVDKWAQSGTKRATDRNIRQYIETLEPYESFFRSLDEDARREASAWSKKATQRANGAMAGAVEVLKAYGVVVGP
jgi:hypothetical protein